MREAISRSPRAIRIRPPATTTPLWLDEPYRPRPALREDLEVEVCIVGGGIGGLATAWHLRQRGVAAAVLEAGAIAGRASGRNGGFFVAGTAPMYNDAARLFGSDVARGLQAATLDEQAQVWQIAEEIGAGGLFRRQGMLRLGVDHAEAEHVREHQARLAADGFPGTLVLGDDLPPPLRRPGRLGLMTPHDGTFHPARFLRALSGALERRGVAIYENTPVRAPVSQGVLATPRARVRAPRVVVAVDGALSALVPALAGRVRSRRLHMVATAAGTGPRIGGPVYARYGHEYYHQLADGRVALGGFSDLDGPASYTDRDTGSPAVFARLERYLREELGLSAPVTHRWVGIVGYTHEWRPYVGPVPEEPGLWVLGGYCGTGNVMAWVAARLVAELLVDGASGAADLFPQPAAE